MNYRHVYMLIIEHAKKEAELGLRPKNSYQRKSFLNQYFEFHHILPRTLFPLWAKRKSNIVPLTAREHFFCHQLLTKIYTDSKLIFALWRLCNGTDIQKVYSSKYYECVRTQISEIQSLNNLGENNPNYDNHALAGKNNPMYGKNLKDFMTPEAYKDMRKKQGQKTAVRLLKKVLCIEDNKIMNSCSEVCKIYGISMPTLSRIIRKKTDCQACPGKHFKFI